MNPDVLLNRIRLEQRGLIDIHKKLYEMEHLLPIPDPMQFAKTAESAALLSEKSTAHLRNMFFSVSNEPPIYYYPKAAEAQGIRVWASDNYLRVLLPALLPDKKKRNGCKFLLLPLQAALVQSNIGEVYNLITQCSESQLDSLFDVLPLTHPAKAPYSLYQRASDSVRSGVISGLGSRLQVFQSELIKKITAYDEISLELPGQQPCAYYLVTSDQDSTFDFLASLFLSFAFIKLVRYADANCPGGRLPVPVHVLGEELTACGTISELSRRISVIRSRNISMSCVFQNLAGLQNRYPQNQWQEILGNCDVQLFLGCTDQLTAEYVSQRTGIASVAVSSTSKALSTLRVSDYTPQYRESSGVGKRPVLTPDEVLRLPVDEALVILRGHKVLKVHKMDYSLHPAYKQLRECKASAHIPEWRKALPETLETPSVETKASPKAPPKRRGRPAKSKTVVSADKESIITKPENEKEIPHGNEQ